MSKKTLISIIVVLLFLSAINFYMKSQDVKDKEAKIENLKQENVKLKQDIDHLKTDLQELEKRIVVDLARDFKTKQYTVNYDANYGSGNVDLQDEVNEVREKFDDYTTKEGLKYLLLNGIQSYIDRLSHETKSNLSVKNLSFEVTGFEKEKVTLDYDIEIAFERIDQESKKKSISNFGQMRLIKTGKGWKVDADLQRTKSINEVEEELLSKEKG